MKITRKTTVSRPILVLLGILFVARLLPAQESIYHPWNWEVGLRTANFGPYLQTTAPNLAGLRNPNNRLGMEVFLLQRRPNHTFSRLSVGFYGFRGSYRGEVQSYIEDQIVVGQSYTSTAATIEGAYGVELPQLNGQFLQRFRLRAGLSLALQAMQNQALRISYINFQGDHGYFHHLSDGGTYWRGTLFFQPEFMVAPHVFLGLELHCGPSLFLHSLFSRREQLVANINGYQFDRIDTENNGPQLIWSTNLGLPTFNLGISF